MLKIKNKFLYFVVFLIVVIISTAVYIAVFQKGIDRNSYIELVIGTALLNDENLEINKRYKLGIDDVITTTSQDALAIIEWGDGSVTRLGGNTSLKINDLFVSKNKDKLNISFELFNGKTWSTVVSFIPENSYFIQSFMDVEAAVRGTIFNVDLENNYLYVLEHQVELTRTNGEKIEIDENKPFDLKTFTFIRLEEFIKLFKDTAFENLNRALDAELLSFIKRRIQENLQSFLNFTNVQIENLSEIKKEELYNEILPKYQELNFANGSDGLLYDLKMNLKEKLYELAPDEEKQTWLNSLVSDFKDTISSKSYDTANKIMEILIENKNNLSISIQNSLSEYTSKIEIPTGLKDAFIDNFNRLKDTFGLGSN